MWIASDCMQIDIRCNTHKQIIPAQPFAHPTIAHLPSYRIDNATPPLAIDWHADDIPQGGMMLRRPTRNPLIFFRQN